MSIRSWQLSRAIPATNVPNPRENQIFDPLYLFACQILWETEQEPSAAWELLAATESPNSDLRACARTLLESSTHFKPKAAVFTTDAISRRDTSMKDGGDYNQFHRGQGFFHGLSVSAVNALEESGHKILLPARELLFVEGESPCGIFILCSGTVQLSSSSSHGKVISFKRFDSGELLGLSAAISNERYEATAEAVTGCDLIFVERQHVLQLMQTHGEPAVQMVHYLSCQVQATCREFCCRASSLEARLARLLLSQCKQNKDVPDAEINPTMTHEEIAQSIGASRETVTRLLCNLKEEQVICYKGKKLAIHNRAALEALAA